MRRLSVLTCVTALATALGGCPFFTTGDAPGAPSEAPAPVPAPAPAPREAPTPAPTAAPAAPGRIAARHVLVQYQGSQRAGASITRTKEEAAARAADVAARARRPGADFAALAREFSDGPSGPRGGDLGEFGRGQMVGPFEEAAFGLAVDAVSDVVETPFGYHVIQRYR